MEFGLKLTEHELVKAKFHYAILVADRFEPASNLFATIFEPASNLLRTSFEPDSVMEFGFYSHVV